MAKDRQSSVQAWEDLVQLHLCRLLYSLQLMLVWLYVVAAGNENDDACSYSPASASAAVTVGATTSSDGRAWYSNYGSCLDIFAPGSQITSAGHESNSALATLSGTSMATPHVAGAAALLLQNAPSASAAQIISELKRLATSEIIDQVAEGS